MNNKEVYVQLDAKVVAVDLTEIYMLNLESKSRGNDKPGTPNRKWDFEEQGEE